MGKIQKRETTDTVIWSKQQTAEKNQRIGE